MTLLVPALADMGVVYLLTPGQGGRAVAHATAAPEDAAALAELGQTYWPDPDNPNSLMSRALRSGEPLLTGEFSEALLASVPPAIAGRLRQLALNSCMLTPLIAHGRTLGLILLGRNRSRRAGETDLALADELSRRAALALDNARLYAEAREQTASAQARVQERTETLRHSERRWPKPSNWPRWGAGSGTSPATRSPVAGPVSHLRRRPGQFRPATGPSWSGCTPTTWRSRAHRRRR